MAPNQKRPAGPPIDLGDMRQLGVRGLTVQCLNPQCRHQVVFSADDYSYEVPLLQARRRLPRKDQRQHCGVDNGHS